MYSTGSSYPPLLTDPENHDPNNYMFIVRGIRFAHRHLPEPEGDGSLIGRVNQILSPNGYYWASFVGKLDSENTSKLFGSSGVEIDQQGCVGSTGFIIEPRQESIKIAWDRDLDSRHLERFVEIHGGKIRDPYELLTQSSQFASYNELIIGGPGTKITGIFYKIADEDKYSDFNLSDANELQKLIKDTTGKLVPIIAIPENEFQSELDKRQRRILHLESLNEFYDLPDYIERAKKKWNLD